MHPSVKALPDDHELSAANIKEWIKIQQYVMTANKAWRRSDDKHMCARYYQAQSYISNMRSYLQTGIWKDLFYGANQEHKMGYRCVRMVYHDNGVPKRTIGVFYPDIRRFWKEGMVEEEWT